MKIKTVFEIIISLVLINLIIFRYQPVNIITSRLHLTIMLLLLLLIFLTLNPIIGILVTIIFLNYFANNNFQYTKSVTLNKMNSHLYNSQVEEEVIQIQAPIINQNKNNNVSFGPYLEKSYSELS